MQVKFKHWTGQIYKGRYSNGRIALVLAEDSESSMYEPVAVCTVNLPHVELQENETIIKDYSEGEGMLQSLIDAGVVTETGRRVKTGFVTVPIVIINGLDSIPERGA